ncbi:MAG: ribosome biogenesis GTPase Der [Candidatus Kerfeldbacteria bacterium CG_4_10_14_0_8_um_filter_42_10]|uniref:GTPase Der n=1 Tax=Candidatus Kerfeldbacteria bacterium CG_4_10_14_0_8_um_filter_42_10 TaxID=2014248 RepID=A0A2M7RFA2_9BACT|nr:MAG: ribosome biogenesis GTPase Der [Candidatus Kerfeldbacteria bacterium CG_4_10_14_0_8_um_filter_42_10]
MSKKNPIVAIIGRTNVGKSSLFNRLVERRKAIISDLPATTRDRNYSTVYWKGEKFTIIDSGGLDIKKGEAIEEDIRKQAEIAAQEADLILLLTDGKKTVTPKDKEIARWLKKIKQPKILVVNKVDNLKIRNRLESDFFKLGLGKPFLISALNGSGSGDLLDEIADKLPKFSSADKEPDLRIAVVGKTNVGKSSFVNALLGEERVIVSPIPHTTRDPQEIEFRYKGKTIILIDTAGLRRKNPEKGKSDTKEIEKESARKSLGALKNADVALLMLDATDQISFQDKHIANEIIEAKTGIVVVINKWDLIQNKSPKTLKQYLLYVHSHFPFLLWVPYVFVSATKKIRLKDTLDFALKMKQNRERTVDSAELQSFLDFFNESLPKGMKNKETPPFESINQIGTTPPQFDVATAAKTEIPNAIMDILKNSLREEFNLWGTPLIIKQVKSTK